MAVAPAPVMAKPTKKNNNEAPQNAGDTTAAMIARDRLAQRAYELYLARGGQDGRDVDDWLTAEQELRGGADGRHSRRTRVSRSRGPHSRDARTVI